MVKKIKTLKNNVSIFQITDEAVETDVIYCERSYTSKDSRRFIFRRDICGKGLYSWPDKCQAEFISCEFNTWETRIIGSGNAYADITRDGNLYYLRPASSGDEKELVKLDLMTEEEKIIPINGGAQPMTGMTFSPDERYLAYGIAESYAGPQSFAVELVDLRTGTKKIICRNPYISNPHTQFNQKDGKHIMVQQNRGSKFEVDGKATISSTNDPGTTHFLVNIDDEKITPLRIGPPYTPTVTGHSQWIENTDEILVTVNEEFDDGSQKGTLLKIAAGKNPEVVCPGIFNHLHVSTCGRLFLVDDVTTNDVYIGSVRTGKTKQVCNLEMDYMEANKQFGEIAHAHMYLSRDLRWMVYNSPQSGRPEVYVASIPETLTKELLEHK